MSREICCAQFGAWKHVNTYSCTSIHNEEAKHRAQNGNKWRKSQKKQTCFNTWSSADSFNLVSGKSTCWLFESCFLLVFFCFFVGAEWMALSGKLAGEQCQAWASTCERAVPGCDRSVRVSRYVGQSPGTPSMGTRGEASGLERKWRIIQWASERHFHWSHTG